MGSTMDRTCHSITIHTSHSSSKHTCPTIIIFLASLKLAPSSIESSLQVLYCTETVQVLIRMG